MKKLIEAKTVKKDAHHLFTYEDGKKTPIPDDGVVFCYLSRGGMLKVDEFPDVAGSIEGKFVVTDEITNNHGNPCVNGHTYTIFGAGEDFVWLAKNKSEEGKYHTKNVVTENKVVVTSRNNPKKKEELEILRQIYMMLI